MFLKFLVVNSLLFFTVLLVSCNKEKENVVELNGNSEEQEKVQEIETDPLAVTEEGIEEPEVDSIEDSPEPTKGYTTSIKNMYYSGRYSEIINTTVSNDRDLFYKGMSFYMLGKKSSPGNRKSLIQKAIAIFDRIAINSKQKEMKGKAALWKGILTLVYDTNSSFKLKMKPFVFLIKNYQRTPFYDDGLFYAARTSQQEDRYDLAANYFSRMKKLKEGSVYDVWVSKFISVRKAIAKYGKGSSSGFAFGSRINPLREKEIVDKLYEMTLQTKENEDRISGVQFYQRNLGKKRAPVTPSSKFETFEAEEDNDNKELNKAIDQGL